MASSVLRPHLRLHLPTESTLRRAQAVAHRATVLARRDPQRFLWLAMWLPFWIGSEVPAPVVPGRGTHRDTAPPHDEAGDYLRSRADRLARQFALGWAAGALMRGVTLALLALAVWVGLAIVDVASMPGWPAIWACLAVFVMAGAVYGWLARPDRLMMAIMLDRTFGLRERLVTAFDRSHGGGQVSRLQLADAANTFDDAHAELPRAAYVPIREGALCLIVAGGLLALLLAYVPHDRIDPLASDAIPQFLPASERLAEPEQPLPEPPPSDQPVADQASIADIQERGRQSQSTRNDLQQVGEALEDHALTRPAAEAIERGEYAAAADSLRSASQSIASMSQEERDAMADDLDEAAQEISEENPELAQQVSETADAIRKGGPEAEQAVNDLADAIEESGEQVESQDDLARDLDEAQSGTSDSGEQGQGSEGQQQSEGSSQGDGEQSASEGGSQGNPGDGSAAEPGLGNQGEPGDEPADQGESDGTTEEGGGQGSSSDSQGEPSSSGQSGEGTTGQSESSNGEGGNSSSDSGITGNPDDETDASQGSGAGTGQSNANDQASESEGGEAGGADQQTAEVDVPGEGEAGDPPPSRGDRGEQDDGRGTDSQGSTTLELEGTSDEGVQTGGDSGSSSLGSGSDASSGSGDQAQTEVGLAGPDSNRVPDALRDIVRDFFEEEP